LYLSEHSVLCKDGTYKEIIDRGKIIEWDDDKNPIRMIGTFADITKEKVKRNQTNKLYQVIKQSPISIVITDLEGNIEYVNKKFCKMTGYEKNEVLGKNPNICKTDYYSNSDYKKLWDTISRGEVWKGIFKNKRKDGTIFWERAKISSLRNKNNKMINYIAYKEDITSEKIFEDQISQNQKLECIGKLTGGIAHDFNNILTAILGYTEIAKDKIDDKERAVKNIDMVLKMVNKASVLTNKLLTFGSKEIIKLERININDTFKDFLKILYRVIGEDIKIEMNLSNNISLIEADVTQIEQIIMNVFINARDAINYKTDIASDKEITFTTSEVVIDKDFVSKHIGSNEGRYVKMSIIDNGIGMDDKTLKKIYEPFFSTKESGNDTGLGLSSVYGIIKQNKGNIIASSKLNSGTSFDIYWPVLEKDNTNIDKSEENEEINLEGNEKILFVEDDIDIRTATVESLKLYGYKVTEANNGLEALEIINSSEKKFDILIIDIIMPKMNANELTKQITNKYSKSNIIYCSGYIDNDIITNDWLETGVNFIQKPYDTKQLVKKIREIINKKNVSPNYTNR